MVNINDIDIDKLIRYNDNGNIRYWICTKISKFNNGDKRLYGYSSVLPLEIQSYNKANLYRFDKVSDDIVINRQNAPVILYISDDGPHQLSNEIISSDNTSIVCDIPLSEVSKFNRFLKVYRNIEEFVSM